MFFFRQLSSELAERNSTKTGHMLRSECDLKMHVRNLGYSLRVQIRGPKATFSTTSQLNGKFNGLYLRNETRYRESGKCIGNYKGSLTLSRNVMNFGHTRLKTRPEFLPTLRKFCLLLHCQASSSKTEISKWNSTKLCQVMGSKSP